MILTLVLIVFGLAKLALELGADLIQQLVQPCGTVSSGRHASHSAMRVHGHFCDTRMKR